MEPTRTNIFGAFSEISLSQIVSFHNCVKRLLSREYPDGDSLPDNIKKADLEHFTTINAVVTFLLGYAYLEETLLHLWQVKLDRQPPEGVGLDRHKALLKQLGIELRECSVWQFLQDASAVRHCILHSNGRISMMRNPNDLEEIVRRTPGQLEISKDRIVIKPEYVDEFVKNVRKLREAVLQG